MPRENKTSEALPEPAVQGDEWDGPWGSISPVPNSVATLCVQIENEAGKPRIYYYPYRTIGKWSWTIDRLETLEIQAAGVRLEISGTGLRRLAEALNLGQLRLVQLNEPPALTGQICVRAVVIQEVKN